MTLNNHLMTSEVWPEIERIFHLKGQKIRKLVITLEVGQPVCMNIDAFAVRQVSTRGDTSKQWVKTEPEK